MLASAVISSGSVGDSSEGLSNEVSTPVSVVFVVSGYPSSSEIDSTNVPRTGASVETQYWLTSRSFRGRGSNSNPSFESRRS